MTPRAQFVEALVDCAGIEEPLTYAIPEGVEVRLGDILAVPLQNRTVGAIALNLLDETDRENVKPIREVLGTGLLSEDYWLLLQMTAHYYRTPLIQVLKTALPPQMLATTQYRWQVVACPIAPLSPAGQKIWELVMNSQDISQRYLRQKAGKDLRGIRELQELGCLKSYLASKPRPKVQYQDVVIWSGNYSCDLSSKQLEIIRLLQQHHGELAKQELLKQAHTTPYTLNTLSAQGIIVIEKREVLRLGGKSQQRVMPDQPKALTAHQQVALQTIQASLGTDQILLLEGVTGSGKTEVYLQAIALVLKQGQSALVLVPEIGLTSQLTDRFRARFGDEQILLYHSQLSDGERFDTWRSMLSPQPQIVIGTRSAVFAPLPNLGIIILDEEHDPSFKQDQPQPCYHARKVAQWRSQLTGIPLILGSATPSSEVIFGEMQGRIKQLTLPERINRQPLPRIEVVDMRQELAAGNYSIFSRTLQQAIAEMLSAKQQGILFIHRRGFHAFVSCRDCGYVVKCPHCDVSLAYHLEGNVGSLRCHYCGYTAPQPHHCPACGSTRIKHFGSGTQRVAQTVMALFPQARIIRFDSDTTRKKDQHRFLIEEFRAGTADLLIGTQMLTKGLDIPQVTLVGIVSADGLLNFSDYRATERTCQTLLQVAGRCGRGAQTGRVILQTYTPEHPAIQAVQNYQYREFILEELQHRAMLHYPPCSQMVLLCLSSENAELVANVAHQLAEWLQQTYGEYFQILGAHPAPIAMISDRWRWQIILKIPHAHSDLMPDLHTLRQMLPTSQVRLTMDIDPLQII
ncbi:MAG: primosomal protein N' [Pseudanabaenaceae cyanobacterium]